MEKEHVPLDGEQLFETFVQLLQTFSRESNEGKKEIKSPKNLEAASLEFGRITQKLRRLTSSFWDHTNVVKEDSDIIAFADALASYFHSCLSYNQFQSLSTIINSTTINWLHTLLRLPISSGGFYLRTNRDARVSVTRNAIAAKFPLFLTKGFQAFQDVVPVLYTTRLGLHIEELRFQLGLPLVSICLCKNAQDFEDKINNDKESNRVPFMLIVTTGDEDTGKGDDVSQYLAVCQSNNIWLHVEGEMLVYLAATSIPNHLQSVLNADSFLFNAAQLFKHDFYTIPTVFHRREKLHSSLQDTYSQVNTTTSTNLVDHGPLTINLWLMLQLKGSEYFHNLLDSSLKKAASFYSKVVSLKYIVTESPEGSDRVVFRYQPIYSNLAEPLNVAQEKLDSDSDDSNSEIQKTNELVTSSTSEPISVEHEKQSKPQSPLTTEFLNLVNEQILYDLNQSKVYLDLDIISIGGYKYLRFRPLFSSNTDITSEHINTFVGNLNTEISLINATISLRGDFSAILQSYSGLIPVDIANFVGLGAVRYVPPYLSKGVHQGRLKEELDKLNEAVAENLNNLHQIYKPAVDVNGFKCIALRVDITNLTEEKVLYHAKLINDTAKQLEASSNLTAVFGDIIKQGIKQAEEQILKETKKSEEGLIRKIPIVGSVWSWWSPPQKKSSSKSFDILSQQLEINSTDKLLKSSQERSTSKAKESSPTLKDSVDRQKETEVLLTTSDSKLAEKAPEKEVNVDNHRDVTSSQEAEGNIRQSSDTNSH
eukprot:TRINITY_DN676_c0_g2_i1.p1 TRINITY_DN676_c0_g2~~TRINITY_DN676_c0_g2_i1.p1  ORF type:complete len:764 (-),score=131.17 TRINITY_DN676_c0_g2_i1:47-2338(-)